MNTKRAPFVLLAALLAAGPAPLAAAPYDARIRDKEILTPAPAAAPRINGPKIHGARPDKRFLYRIPTQGVRPMSFEAEGLPGGLVLDAANGIITGRTPARPGEFTVTFRASNAAGRDERPFRLVIGDQIALTPPTGWNSWGGQMVNVTDADMRLAADVFVARGLADVGFQYVGIDDCWMRLTQAMHDTRPESVVKKHASYDYVATGTIGPIRDGNGDILPNGKFPDMKALTAYIHSKGLKAGIYSSPGPQTCQRWAGSGGHELADATRFAAWGFDLLKYDLCTGGDRLRRMRAQVPGFREEDFWEPMVRYLRIQDHDMLYNLCQYGMKEPWTWAPGIGIQTWRTGGDLNHNVRDYFKEALRVATTLRDFNRPGQWNDPDFMYIHRIRDVRRMGEPSEEIPLNTNQRYQYVTLWSIICAPFFFSCDIAHIDDFTVGLLANAEVVNLNQDERGHTAEVLRDDPARGTVMLKRLAGGQLALAVFNRDPAAEATVSVAWSELGLKKRPAKVFDAWRHRDCGPPAEPLQVRLSPDGVGLFVVTP
ncbi:MAG: putative Ig domain-containing protein [Akkermansiaceae bacterium]|nr:putative Ig domain-containing protein [Akkermansiaceae bacterium]